MTQLKQAMIKYSKGHWTLTAPTKPGCYAVMPRGLVCKGLTGTSYIGAYEAGNKIHYTHDWRAWWWSEPLPSLPRTPDNLEEGVEE